MLEKIGSKKVTLHLMRFVVALKLLRELVSIFSQLLRKFCIDKFTHFCAKFPLYLRKNFGLHSRPVDFVK